MIDLPRRHTLVSQTAGILRSEIARGTWRELLPGERALCETLQVSRNTLRGALAQLRRDGLIESRHGSGNRILTTASKRGTFFRSRDVALLAPEALERLRPAQTLWIDELRAMLSEHGCRLHIMHGHQYFRVNSNSALKKLVEQHPHGCWILLLSNEGIQRWFQANGLPAIVAGSVFGGIELPFRDLDHRAMCRHAAGLMLGHGHRRLGLIIPEPKIAGDIESVAGFVDGVRSSTHADAEAILGYHDSTLAGIGLALRRLMERKLPPTALLVANAYHYLTVVSRLALMGYNVPTDVSVVSRDDDPFLSFLLPAPTRYVASANGLAKTLLRPVVQMLEGGVVSHRAVRIMPEFIRGDTLAALVGRANTSA